MPRPSWFIYTTTPAAFALDLLPSRWWSCGPQSQRQEPKISPVTHEECTRTSTGSSGSR